MSARPLMNTRIEALEGLFATHGADLPTLKLLVAELRHRETYRAVALLNKVERAVSTTKTSDAVGSQSDIWDSTDLATPNPARAPQHRPVLKPIATPQSVLSRVLVAQTVALPLVATASPTPSMGVEAAYQILRATPTSTWSAIEQTRREIVQRAFPAAIAALSLEKQTVIKADASKANAAYAVLRQVRQ